MNDKEKNQAGTPERPDILKEEKIENANEASAPHFDTGTRDSNSQPNVEESKANADSFETDTQPK